eukprot:14975655-Alexandrium_andersonii.AAC.1
MSSARLAGTTDMHCVSRARGLTIPASSIMDQGHPCGMPRVRRCGLPSPNGNELSYTACRWKA